jgi:pyruvate dehydrogenase E2 component (dihydrolipoamide acetyltransferase)
MKQPITMPALSDTMNNGRLVKWLKQPGDQVKSGESVAEVETDKAVMDVEAFHAGYLAGPLASVDQELPVGDTIGYIADTAAEAGEEKASAAPAKVAATPAPKPAAKTVAKASVNAIAEAPAKAPAKQSAAASAPKQTPTLTTVPADPASQHFMSPILAAAEANRPSGGGVHAHALGAPRQDQPGAATNGLCGRAEAGRDASVPAFLADGPPYTIARASSLREAVARNMIASAVTPSFRVTALLPLAGLMAMAKAKGASLSLLLARACARAIKAHPLLNAAYTETGLAQRERVDVAIAVESPDGLITPVLRDAAERSFAELSADWQALREKVKSRRLMPSDYRGATFYLSDLGVFPVVYAFDSVIPAGASAILSVAASRAEGAFATLSCDHRVVFGGDAARFLQTLAEIISAPAKLFEDKSQ